MKNNIVLISPSNTPTGGVNVFMNNLQFSMERSPLFKNTRVRRVYTAKSKGYFKIISALISFVRLLFLGLISSRHTYYISAASGRSILRKAALTFPLVVLKRKVILHMHGGDFSSWANKLGVLECSIYSFFFRSLTKIYCLNNEHASVFARIFNVTAKNIRIVNNFIDDGPACFQVAKDKEIVFIGGIDSNKGVDYLAHAFSELETSYSLNLYGPLGNLSKDEIVMNYYRGVIKEEKWGVLEKAHIFVLPSKIENFPLSLIEAARSSCLIMYTGVGCVNEILIPNTHYVPIDLTKDSIKKVLQLVMADPKKLELIRKAAFSKSLELTSDSIIQSIKMDLDL